MALGRIRRDKKKISRANQGARKGPVIATTIQRHGAEYAAHACIKSPRLPGGRVRGKMTPAQLKAGTCGGGYGRTPQAAIAKAIKKLAGAIARRGRR